MGITKVPISCVVVKDIVLAIAEYKSYSYEPVANNLSKNNSACNNGPWIMDSGALRHVTKDIQNLSIFNEYDVEYELLIGDGAGLAIMNTVSTTLQTFRKPLHLNNILHVPTIKNNLIYVSKLCKNNLVTIEFF